MVSDLLDPDMSMFLSDFIPNACKSARLCDVHCVHSPQGTRMFSLAAALGFGVLVHVGLALPLVLFILTTVCPQSAKYNDVYLEKKSHKKFQECELL